MVRFRVFVAAATACVVAGALAPAVSAAHAGPVPRDGLPAVLPTLGLNDKPVEVTTYKRGSGGVIVKATGPGPDVPPRIVQLDKRGGEPTVWEWAYQIIPGVVVTARPDGNKSIATLHALSLTGDAFRRIDARGGTARKLLQILGKTETVSSQKYRAVGTTTCWHDTIAGGGSLNGAVLFGAANVELVSGNPSDNDSTCRVFPANVVIDLDRHSSRPCTYDDPSLSSADYKDNKPNPPIPDPDCPQWADSPLPAPDAYIGMGSVSRIEWNPEVAITQEANPAQGTQDRELAVFTPDSILYHELLHAARAAVGMRIEARGTVHSAATFAAARKAIAKQSLDEGDLVVSTKPDRILDEWAISATPELYQFDGLGEREAQQVARLSDLRDRTAGTAPGSAEVAAWDRSNYIASLLAGNTYEGDVQQLRLGYVDLVYFRVLWLKSPDAAAGDLRDELRLYLRSNKDPSVLHLIRRVDNAARPKAGIFEPAPKAAVDAFNKVLAGSGNGLTVSMGDSYISGEAGRWKGNDTLVGETNYDKFTDRNLQENTDVYNVHDSFHPDGSTGGPNGCHRSDSAPVFGAKSQLTTDEGTAARPGGVLHREFGSDLREKALLSDNVINLACSGASNQRRPHRHVQRTAASDQGSRRAADQDHRPSPQGRGFVHRRQRPRHLRHGAELREIVDVLVVHQRLHRNRQRKPRRHHRENS
ncbi:hypothetical protein [Amycolatopsis nalaikhensis]|uniref:Uncharacterized protein n=1 Tax=Amycolatopsis nalaikhensis TaxID=715472 RepID=A0ABY8XBK2_9PSEU|nr:hypothetical protein [Amycolatopsis sp. 2-2]WIV52941.1 hypothetical protein QP939_28810 [Amycolatopsis sp. 2-2]